jgi:hypothetical protein
MKSVTPVTRIQDPGAIVVGGEDMPEASRILVIKAASRRTL